MRVCACVCVCTYVFACMHIQISADMYQRACHMTLASTGDSSSQRTSSDMAIAPSPLASSSSNTNVRSQLADKPGHGDGGAGAGHAAAAAGGPSVTFQAAGALAPTAGALSGQTSSPGVGMLDADDTSSLLAPAHTETQQLPRHSPHMPTFTARLTGTMTDDSLEFERLESNTQPQATTTSSSDPAKTRSPSPQSTSV